MTPTSTVPMTARTLDVPGVRLYYEVRGEGPLVVLVGSPMDATSFEPLANLLATDHTVLTTDPRGIKRSPLDDPEQDSTPRLRADDLSLLIEHVNAGPATVVGSSGGAVSALALAQAYPEHVRAVVAHEAPLIELLAHRDQMHAETEDIIATHLAGDVRGAWAKFLAQANIHMPDEMFETIFGGKREPQQAADEYFWFAHELRGTTHWRPDLAALRSSGARIVVGIGEDSTDQICDHTSRALAAALGTEPTLFPGDHLGFVERSKPFAARLREVLPKS